MKKLVIPFVIVLMFIGSAFVVYRNGYANEQPNAPMAQATAPAHRVAPAQAEVAHKMSTAKPLPTPKKEPTAAPTEIAATPTAHAMDHMAPAATHQDNSPTPTAHAMDHMASAATHQEDGHTSADHMAADHNMSADQMAAAHGVPAEAAAVKNPISTSSESISRGAAIFSQNCAVCHGKTGEGDGPGAAALNPKPADLHADHVQGNSDGTMFWIISHGREGTVMPAWNTALSEKQRWDVVNFLRTFR